MLCDSLLVLVTVVIVLWFAKTTVFHFRIINCFSGIVVVIMSRAGLCKNSRGTSKIDGGVFLPSLPFPPLPFYLQTPPLSPNLFPLLPLEVEFTLNQLGGLETNLVL